MKPNELIIGNLVFIPETNQTGTVTCVHELMGVVINNSLSWVPFDKIEPITLNEKWMINCGFVFYNNTYYRKEINTGFFHTFICISLEYKTLCFGNDNTRFKYPEFVHQLQNAYNIYSNNPLIIK